MLEELHARDLALITEAWLEFGPGMTVLTGETGAGKTVLVGALKLLIGERADSSLVSTGAGEAVVEGRFSIGGEERLVRRRLSADGRSRCTVDGDMATVGELQELVGPLVDLHGQHEHQALLQPARHAGYLDRFAGPPALHAKEAYTEAFDRHAAAVADRDALSRTLADRERRLDLLRFQLAEIESAAVHAEEDDELSARLPALRHAGRLTESAGRALEALGEEGARDALSAAQAALAGVAALDPALEAIASALDDSVTALDDVASDLRHYAEGIEHDPLVLEEVESRLAAITLLKKKYGPTLADVLRTAEESSSSLALLEDAERGSAEAEARVSRAEAVLREAGERLVALRAEAAPSFEAALAEAASELAMPHARFGVSLGDLPFSSWTREGPQRVEFLFSSVASAEPRPLARIASGGEVSRVMLALKGVLGAADPVPVLVFDEVDAGIGGAAAIAVGRRLAALAKDRQVLVVTHLAQVAAVADAHYVVEKREQPAGVVTVVERVDGERRVAEVARMLAGGNTEAGLAHARELLDAVMTGG